MNIRSVLYILGILTSTLGCMMLFPAIFNFIKHENKLYHDDVNEKSSVVFAIDNLE